MKKTKAHKTRAHRPLFDNTLPFQPKREELKTKYSRKEKHKGKPAE